MCRFDVLINGLLPHHDRFNMPQLGEMPGIGLQFDSFNFFNIDFRRM